MSRLVLLLVCCALGVRAQIAAGGQPRPEGLNLTINDGANSTNSQWVAVTVVAMDRDAVTGYYLSESSITPNADASGWVAVDPVATLTRKVEFTLSPGNGPKAVSVWFRNAAGAVSEPVSDSILYVYNHMDNVHSLALRPDGRELYARALDRPMLVVTDLTVEEHPVVAEIMLPWLQDGHPPDVMEDTAFSPDGRYAYVSGAISQEFEDCNPCTSLYQIAIIDTQTHIARHLMTSPPFTGF